MQAFRLTLPKKMEFVAIVEKRGGRQADRSRVGRTRKMGVECLLNNSTPTWRGVSVYKRHLVSEISEASYLPFSERFLRYLDLQNLGVPPPRFATATPFRLAYRQH